MNLDEIKNLLSTPWAIIVGLFFLCASIIIHELGHFLAAKWRGLVVERFSIGFGPRIWGWKKGGVDYRISAIPLGGYVALPQLAGMETMEGGPSGYDSTSLPPLSPLNKIIVSLAGPAFNVLFALLLGLIIWSAGRPVRESQETTVIGYVHNEFRDRNDVVVTGPAWSAGLRPGDRITAIDGHKVGNWLDIAQAIATSSDYDSSGMRLTTFTVDRNGKTLTIRTTPMLAPSTGMREVGIEPRMPAVVGEVFDNSPAMNAGLKPGDRITEVDGERIEHIAAAGKRISASGESPHSLTILRAGETIHLSITPEVVDDGQGNMRPMIGVRWAPEGKVVVHENPLKLVSSVFYMTFDVLHALVNPRSDVRVKDMSGPVGIAHALIVSAKENIVMLLFFVLFININLAVVNLLPLPVLDGGHILFAIVEAIIRRPLPQKFLVAAQSVFMILLLVLMAYVTLQDINREVDMARAGKEIRKEEAAPPPVFGSETDKGPVAQQTEAEKPSDDK